MRLVKRLLATATVATLGAVLGVSAPAAAWPTTYFEVCAPSPDCGISPAAQARGWFTWYNRTTHIEGWIQLECNHLNEAPAWVFFDAFAGAVKFDSIWERSYTCDNPDLAWFETTLGDTNRVGGMDRIRVIVTTGPYADWISKTNPAQNFQRPPL